MRDASGNIVIEQAEHDGLTLQLSNYAAHALLRRLQGVVMDDTERVFMVYTAELIERALETQ